MSAIFISYRGNDGGYAAGFVDERLRHAFGDTNVFLDRRSLPPGVDFPPDLWRHLSRCEILLVLIGPRWLDSNGPRGTRRIDDPDDYVRREIRYSLERDIMVIPIILTKAKPPTAEQLPPDIAGLAERQYLTLRQRYPHDLDRLVDYLSRHVPRTGPAPMPLGPAVRRKWRWAAVVALASLLGALLWFRPFVEPRGAGTATRTVGPTGSEPVSSQPGSQPSGRPAITASPDHGSPTATFTVRGSHWPAACAGQVNIVLDDSFYSPNPGETNAAGQFSVPFYPTTTRERQLSPGPHTVTGSCADGRYESAPVTYLVTG